MRKLFFTLLLCSLPVFAAIGSGTQWDVRTTGSDTNGGAFDPGVASPGTDESQGATGTAVTIAAAGTTGTSTPAITSTTHGPGNFVNISGGSGCTTGVYEILSQSAGVATFSSSMGTGACTGVLGGSMASICSANSGGKCTVGAFAAAVGQNTIWVKSGTYTCTQLDSSDNLCLVSVNAAGASIVNVTIEGYGTTHADFGAAPVITSAVAATITLVVNGGARLINLKFVGTGSFNYPLVGSPQFTGGGNIQIYDCTFDTSAAASGAGGFYNRNSVQLTVWNNTFINSNTSGYGIAEQGVNNAQLDARWNSFSGGSYCIGDGNANANGDSWRIMGNTFSNCSRAVYSQAGPLAFVDLSANSFQGTTNENVYIFNGGVGPVNVSNNIFWGGTYGVRLFSTGYYGAPQSNAYGNISVLNSDLLYSGFNNSDVSLTANPFTSSSNFVLNSTAGGGALLKAAGFPGVTSAGTGYAAIGALQPNSSGGAAPHAITQ